MADTPTSDPIPATMVKPCPFGYTLDDLKADAAEMVENPLVRAAIMRVKHGQVGQGFSHYYDKAYHSHSST